ncbi:mevalonate kinase family protein [Thermogutta sp.]|uniref:mevalonate kinase family protein n=2 Tax=Thermogutta sp. TaxID=1962930 RepID=UPI003C7CF6BF
MIIIKRRAYARAGLLGNPSDGYYGKTISVIVRNFFAEAVLYEWDQVELVLSQEDRSRFDSIYDLARDVRLHGYYGGIRLVKATIKKFVEYCQAQGIKLHEQNFSIRYYSTIPRQVGLAGSSAIIVAVLRCLMDFYGVQIPQRVQPSLALAVENEELGIAGGLQDRVIQVYEGLVFMDFSRDKMENIHGYNCGVYEPLDLAYLPPLYLAYNTAIAEPTEVIHNDLRGRYLRGEPAVVEAMRKFADLAQQGRQALLERDWATFGKLMDANFDLRRSILKLAPEHIEMVERARKVGVPAKFAGSGGAIVGLCPDDATFQKLKVEMATIHCEVIRPQVIA